MIDKKFGRLTVISEHSKTRNGHIRYACECECGNSTNVLGTHLRQGNTISCGCAIPIGKARTDWTGVGEMSGAFWATHVVTSASGNKGSRRELPLTITKEDAWDLFLKQGRKCALSGIELKFPERHNDRSWTASLDRIDSSEGYIEGNVQWLHKDVNMMKRTYTQEHFVKMCELISDNLTDLPEESSVRGKLVHLASITYLHGLIFENFEDSDMIKGKLQNELNTHLNFETKIGNVNWENSILSGDIYYKPVEGGEKYMVSTFTVVNTGVIA